MTNFPADVVKAEQLTGGNANILSTLETPSKSSSSSKTSSSSTGAGTATANFDNVKKITQSASSPSTNSKKSAGSYNSSVKVQNTTNSVQKPNDKRLTCTMCSFSTDRMNLLMMHIKNHSLTIISRVNCKSTFIALDIFHQLIVSLIFNSSIIIQFRNQATSGCKKLN